MATILLGADGLHNAADGAAIAAAFGISPRLGVITAAAVLIHEVPEEVADYVLLRKAGMSRTRALVAMTGVQLTAAIGALLTLLGTGIWTPISPFALAAVRADRLFGSNENDFLAGNSGQDQMFGGPGNDTLFGQEGDDRLFGGDGNDVIAGGDGQDLVSGDAGDDAVNGEVGDDTVLAGAGNDTVLDCVGHNRIEGGAGTDVCTFNATQSTAIQCETVLSCPPL